jgi:hypothetical protein
MGNVVRPGGGSYYSGGNYTRGPSLFTAQQMVKALRSLAYLGFIGFSLFVAVGAFGVMLQSVPVLIAAFAGTAPPEAVVNITLSAISGLAAGLFIGVLRRCGRKPGHKAKSLVSAVFRAELAAPQWGSEFWFGVILDGIVGVVVGTVTGASGAISIPQLFTDLPHTFLTQTSVIAGGSGGAGGPPGLFLILLTMFVIFMCAIIVGIIAGSIVHLLVLGIAGMAKDTAQDWIQRAMEPAVYERDPKHPWIAAAMRHGFAVGATVGMLEAVCTAVGITQLVVGNTGS